jgi:choline dehydrogenase-like flavoprotein
MNRGPNRAEWDFIVIGSGFGGAMAAYALVNAGHRVLMLERGDWVARESARCDSQGSALTAHYSKEAGYKVVAGTKRYRARTWHCVGGQSVFYGGASYRFRDTDFEHDSAIAGDSGAAWPFRYVDIEPYYGQAEWLLDVAGDARSEPTEPPRGVPYARPADPLTDPARRIADAARRVGFTPSRIPLASDLATSIIPDLIRRGMTLRTNLVCVRLVRSGSRISEIECVDRITGARERFAARHVVLGAGALATPHLLLTSNLAVMNPAGHAVGRYLTRHRNAVVLGFFARCPNPGREFDKQVALLDHYREAGSIQQLTPPDDLVRAYMPALLRRPASMFMSRASGLLVIAEDQPVHENGVHVNWRRLDRYGLPTLQVRQAYTRHDEARAAVLVAHAKRVLREAGALFAIVHPIETFSHALGTVRMGLDDRSAPLDRDGRYRGLDNLYVVDGSALPRSAALNPSLTIAANALRVGTLLSRSSPAPQQATRVLPTRPQPYNDKVL